MTKKQQCPCGNKDTEWSSTEADEIYCPKCGKHTVCGEWPTEPAKYFGYAEFTPEQKMAYDVGYQHGVTDRPEPVSIESATIKLMENAEEYSAPVNKFRATRFAQICAKAWGLKYE